MSDLDEKAVGVADTMFARYDMGRLAIETLEENSEVSVERYTVPGIKDLPVAAKNLMEEYDCDIVIALGMAGSADVDKTCAHEASQALLQVELETGKHVLEVFVHEDEAKDEEGLIEIFEDRVPKHAKNALELLKGKEALTPRAGKGVRQGGKDAGPIGGDEE